MNDTLKIEFVGINSTSGHRLWVKLTSGGVTREVCYLRHSGSYMWDAGENEPPMSNSLLRLFHGKEGEAALKKCAKTRQEVTLTA